MSLERWFPSPPSARMSWSAQQGRLIVASRSTNMASISDQTGGGCGLSLICTVVSAWQVRVMLVASLGPAVECFGSNAWHVSQTAIDVRESRQIKRRCLTIIPLHASKGLGPFPSDCPFSLFFFICPGFPFLLFHLHLTLPSAPSCHHHLRLTRPSPPPIQLGGTCARHDCSLSLSSRLLDVVSFFFFKPPRCSGLSEVDMFRDASSTCR
jgi:hypothetical protein